MPAFQANRLTGSRVFIAALIVFAFLLFIVSFTSEPVQAYERLSESVKQGLRGSGGSAATVPNTVFHPSKSAAEGRGIFVDLGANIGDSVRVFLKEPGTSWTYEFPKPFHLQYNDFECFLFEANPLFNKQLEETKELFAKKPKPVKVTIFPGTLVATEDGFRDMMIDTWSKEHNFWGSSMYGWNEGDEKKMQSLPAKNFAKFLIDNFAVEDYVVVKMDIEGAEYEVLPHLWNTGAYKLIDVLLVEWHPHHPAWPKAKQDPALSIAREFVKEGMYVPEYDSPA
ncbi:FkbM family methyltransferase [Phlyctochytrium arcticum]|nr:FkbM family methyltransferase [Phlyctochytrium arcticum]